MEGLAGCGKRLRDPLKSASVERRINNLQSLVSAERGFFRNLLVSPAAFAPGENAGRSHGQQRKAEGAGLGTLLTKENFPLAVFPAIVVTCSRSRFCCWSCTPSLRSPPRLSRLSAGLAAEPEKPVLRRTFCAFRASGFGQRREGGA